MSTDTARLIICERTGDWAVSLRRELADAGVRIWETRTLVQCWDLLAEFPNSFAIVEFSSANADDLLRRMDRSRRVFPEARIAVVAERALAEYQWLARESGAVHFTCSPRQLGPLTKMACRHLARAPVVPQCLAERIWAGLPWSQ